MVVIGKIDGRRNGRGEYSTCYVVLSARDGHVIMDIIIFIRIRASYRGKTYSRFGVSYYIHLCKLLNACINVLLVIITKNNNHVLSFIEAL